MTTSIPIRIECGCGQHFASDIEPVGGRMPVDVACPTCGADATGAANALITQSLAAEPAAPVPPTVGVTLRRATPPPEAAPATTPDRPSSRLGQKDRPQAEQEARAKISWGDAPKEVVKFLMIQGFERDEAMSFVNTLSADRVVTVRRNGIRNIIIGVLLVCVPIVTFLVFRSMGMLPLKILGATGVVGVVGAWKLLNGIFMVVAPKSEGGDVANQ